MDRIRTKFIETNLLKHLWGETIRCSSYEYNRCPTKGNSNVTPAEIWYEKNDIAKLKIFGSKAWRVILSRQSKLDPRANPGIIVGYNGNGYRLWDPAEDRVVSSKDTIFYEINVKFEKIMVLKNIEEEGTGRVEDDLEEEEEIQTCQQSEDPADMKTDEELEGGESRSKRIVKKPTWQTGYELYTAYCSLTQRKIPQTSKKLY